MARYVKNNSRLRQKLRQFPKDLTADIPKALDQAGRDIVSELNARAPMLTGRLSKSASYKVSSDGLGMKAGYSGKTAGFKMMWKRGGASSRRIEYGTKHSEKQPYVNAVFRANLIRVLDRVDAAVMSALKKASSLNK